MIFLGLVNQHDKNVTTAFNSSSNQSVSEKSKIITTEHFHYMITSEGIEDSRCQ